MLGTTEIKGMYATNLKQDTELLETGNLSWRKYCAVTHRATQKEVIQSQIRLLGILLEIILRVKDLKDTEFEALDKS